MKILVASAFLLLPFGLLAQNTFPTTGNVGIGTSNPAYKMDIAGGHPDSRLVIHYSDNIPERQADLALWASEPGWTYSGAGIGNNTINGVTGITRINTARGGSYLRLLDQEVSLNVIKLDGTDITALNVNSLGNIGIGTTDTKGYKLAVAGNMVAEQVTVKLKGNWPDYVFNPEYVLPTLKETEQHIKEKGHLPGIPSAAEVKAHGVDLGEMVAKLLQKNEELTLYLIEKDKQLEEIKKRLTELENKNSAMKNQSLLNRVYQLESK